MSDFDKEAEREKLREKYEQDAEKREATEQMSELLLKGATMTNAHCGDCGDPIFRYDGQEFCPTCQKPVDRGTADGDAAADDASGNEAGDDVDGAEAGGRPARNGPAGGDGIEVTAPSDDATVQFGSGEADDAAAATDNTGAVADDSETVADDSETVADGTETTAASGRRDDVADDTRTVPSAAPSDSSGSAAPDHSDSSGPAAPDRSSPPGRPESAPSRSSARPAPAGDAAGDSAGEHLAQAQLVLARTVERYAELAAAADSPRETRAHLETAREAARTLEATGFQ